MRKGTLQEEDLRGHSLASTRGHSLICYPVPLLPPQPAHFFSSLTMALVLLGEAFLPNLLPGAEDVSLLYLVAISVTRRLGEGKGRPSLSSSSLGRHGGRFQPGLYGRVPPQHRARTHEGGGV